MKAENLALRQMAGSQGPAWDPSGSGGEKELLLAAALEEEQGRRGCLQDDNARLRAALVGPLHSLATACPLPCCICSVMLAFKSHILRHALDSNIPDALLFLDKLGEALR